MKNEYEIRRENTAIIIRKRDGSILESIIDTELLDKAKEFVGSWYSSYNKKTKSYYVKGNLRVGNKETTKFLHRYLLSANEKMMVDHINHDTLDNRFENLREVTNADNQQNRMIPRVDNKTGASCVSFCRRERKYIVRVQANGKRHYVGSFHRKSDATQASIEGRKMFQGYSHDISDL